MIKVSRYSLVALTIAAIFTSSVTVAAVYKWVDENGKVHFTDKPPKQLKAKPKIINIKSKKLTPASKFPSVTSLEPIKNIATRDVKSVVLEHLSIDYRGSAEDEKSLGKTYKYTREAAAKVSRLRQSDKALPSAQPCLIEGDLTLNNAKYIIKQVDFNQPFRSLRRQWLQGSIQYNICFAAKHQ